MACSQYLINIEAKLIVVYKLFTIMTTLQPHRCIDLVFCEQRELQEMFVEQLLCIVCVRKHMF